MPPETVKVVRSSRKVPDIFLPILTIFGISRNIFVQVPSTRFQENPSIGSPTDTCGQTGRHADGLTVAEIAVMSIFCHRQQRNMFRSFHEKCPIFLTDFNQIWMCYKSL
jgi:hypothetical protein